MNGIHDMGGMHGFGAVDPRAETGFAEEWQRRAFGVNMMAITARLYNIDETRYWMENVSPDVYLGTPYFVRWRQMIERLLASKGLLATSEIDARVASPDIAVERVAEPKLKASEIWPALKSMRPPKRTLPDAPRHQAGERVVTRNINPAAHTRLPRFLRGRSGTVTRYCGIFPFADDRALDRGDNPQHVYSVRFQGREIWGEDAEENTTIQIEMYESYLEAKSS